MGPPIYLHYTHTNTNTVRSDFRNSVLYNFIYKFHLICLKLTVAIVFFQLLMLRLSCVDAGPVVLNMDYVQGPVPAARNIRHLPCISRRTGQEGVCMFAIDCLKANGSHLGTCIDRFYFGSCCQIPDKTLLPQIVGNTIEDNSIDNANFVHPQENQGPIKLPDVFATRKPVTTKLTTRPVESTTKMTTPIEITKVTTKPVDITTRLTTNYHRKPETSTKSTTSQYTTKLTTSLPLETKSDDFTTIDNNVFDEKVTTVIETTTKTTKAESPVTEVPIKLSTFQSVSNDITTSIYKETTEKDKTTETTTVTTERTKPTRKPTRPTFTRPTYKPYNITRPYYSQSTYRPKPTKVGTTATTRKPPYRLPSKRPSTKKPLPSPPRLNITILPQSTSSKPPFSRPSSVSITYINTTQVAIEKEEPKTTTSTTTTTTTEATTVTTQAVTTQPTTEKLLETTETATEAVQTDKIGITDATSTEVLQVVTEKETLRPGTEADFTLTTEALVTTTDYPAFMTWTNGIEAATKAPEPATNAPEPATKAPEPVTKAPEPATKAPEPATKAPEPVTKAPEPATKAPEPATSASESTEDTWSPVTPPVGWILLSTILPKPETTTTTTTTTTETPTTVTEITEQTQTEQPIVTTMFQTIPDTTTKPTTTSSKDDTQLTTQDATTQTSTTQTSTTQSTTTTQSSTVADTTQSTVEFTVNVTLSPTIPTTTSSVGLTTFTSISGENTTKAENGTSAVTEANPELSTSTNATTAVETTTEFVNMTDYKNVCGRRLWQGPTGRIVGGTKSGFGMWPWQISLRQYRTSTYLHKCGAALLNENWAITAAHCVEHVPPSELLVRLGEHDLANEDEPYGFAERRVQIVASHPHFDPATFEYDLALLRFYEPVTFQPNILPVCVPEDDDNFVGKTAYVTGWGRLYDEGPLPSVLQEVKVPVINNSACEGMYQAAGYNEHIPNIFICAGRSKGGTDSCEGDSGGPMVLRRQRDGRFVLGGIISWGIGCAEPNQPGVYTRISEFRDWINQILQF